MLPSAEEQYDFFTRIWEPEPEEEAAPAAAAEPLPGTSGAEAVEQGEEAAEEGAEVREAEVTKFRLNRTERKRTAR